MSDTLSAFMNSRSNGIFVIGHASALLRIDGKLMLFDPAWDYQPFSGYWKLAPEQINCTKILPKIDACIVSHIHDDHYDPRILKQLECPVYIMGDRPEFEAKMTEMCKQVFAIKKKDAYEIFPGIRVTFLPSSFNPVDSSCFVFSDSYSFYHGNDNFVSIDDLREVRNQIHRMDVACIPYAYLNWYPECMEDYSQEKKRSETDRLIKQMADFGIELTRILNPKCTIPAGANLYYCDDINSPMNKMGITPWEFREICPPDLRYNVCSLTAGDYAIGNHVVQKRDQASFLKDVGELLEGSSPKNLIAEVIPQPHYITKMQEKLKKARHMVDNHAVFFPIKDYFLMVSLNNLQCCYTKMIPNSCNKTIITIEPYQLKEWLEGRMTYEMVVATRKFKMRRDPDDYNVKVFEFILNYL